MCMHMCVFVLVLASVFFSKKFETRMIASMCQCVCVFVVVVCFVLRSQSYHIYMF